MDLFESADGSGRDSEEQNASFFSKPVASKRFRTMVAKKAKANEVFGEFNKGFGSMVAKQKATAVTPTNTLTPTTVSEISKSVDTKFEDAKRTIVAEIVNKTEKAALEANNKKNEAEKATLKAQYDRLKADEEATKIKAEKAKTEAELNKLKLEIEAYKKERNSLKEANKDIIDYDDMSAEGDYESNISGAAVKSFMSNNKKALIIGASILIPATIAVLLYAKYGKTKFDLKSADFAMVFAGTGILGGVIAANVLKPKVAKLNINSDNTF